MFLIHKKYNYFLLIAFFAISTLSIQAAQHDWKTQSVLSTGKWVKIKTKEKGIYKISFSTLKEWGFNNPERVNVYGSGCVHLSEYPNKIACDDLVKNSVWHDT